jgi:hypothetical protein
MLQGEQEWSAAAREQEQRILSLQQDIEELKLTMRHMQVSSPAIRAGTSVFRTVLRIRIRIRIQRFGQCGSGYGSGSRV